MRSYHIVIACLALLAIIVLLTACAPARPPIVRLQCLPMGRTYTPEEQSELAQAMATADPIVVAAIGELITMRAADRACMAQAGARPAKDH